MKKILLTIVLVGVSLASFIIEVGADKKDVDWWSLKPVKGFYPDFMSYLPGESLLFPPLKHEMTFPVSKDKGNFSTFKGIENVAMMGGNLSLTMKNDKGTLCWGNAYGGQPIDKIKSLFSHKMSVSLKIKQEGGTNSEWSMSAWADGTRIAPPEKPEILNAGEWKDLKFNTEAVPNPDGLAFNIRASKGTKFLIKSVSMVKLSPGEGYARKEFKLPSDRIWKAIVNISLNGYYSYGTSSRYECKLFINGREVAEKESGGQYGTFPLNIKPYLKEGDNCIGLYAMCAHWPIIFVSGEIIMESGQVIPIVTSADWQFSQTAQSGWDRPGFNAADWKTGAKKKNGRFLRTNKKLPGIMTKGDSPKKYYYDTRFPGYTGLFDIYKPKSRYLFFRDDRESVMTLACPAGFAGKKPVVSYEITLINPEGVPVETVRKGSIKKFSTRQGSLVFQLNAGMLKDGAYTLKTVLKDCHGKVIEDRPREPFAVLHKLKQKVVNTRSYFDGMDVELEDSIDFTDPKDPHENFEVAQVEGTRKYEKVKTPRIVVEDGLKYREVASSFLKGFEKTGTSGSFSYKINLKHPGDFYVFEIEYPNNKFRQISISVSRIDTEIGYGRSLSGCGAWTDGNGRYFKSGKMEKLRWIGVGWSGTTRVDIINYDARNPAAAKGMKIYHVKGNLPSAGAGNSRFYGIHTESTVGAQTLFGGVFWKNSYWHYGSPRQREMINLINSLPLMQRHIISLYWYKRASENYTQYLKFTGQNIHIIGCHKYNHNRAIPPSQCDLSTIIPGMQDVMANVFDINGINFLANVEFVGSPFMGKTYYNDAQVAKGADSLWMIDSNGKQQYGLTMRDSCNHHGNWMHPAYRRAYYKVIRDLNKKFSHLKNYKGINVFLAASQDHFGVPGYKKIGNSDPLKLTYDDYTFKAFKNDTGVDLGLSETDHQRFKKRAALIAGNDSLKKKFLEWRCRNLANFLKQAIKVLRTKRNDLILMGWFTPLENLDFIKNAVRSGRNVHDVLKELALDVKLLGQIPHLVLSRATLSWRDVKTLNPWAWYLRENPELLDVFRALPQRAAYCRSSWDENNAWGPGHENKTGREHVGCLGKSSWSVSIQTRNHPQPAGFTAREATIQAIVSTDPQWLFTGFCDLGLNVGYEQIFREVMIPYSKLPTKLFDKVLDTGLDTNLAIRKLTENGKTWFYVVNPGYWVANAEIKLQTAAPVKNISDQSTVCGTGEKTLKLKLNPFDFKAFVVETGKLEIKSYSIKPISTREEDHMHRIIDRVKKLISEEQVRLVMVERERKLVDSILKSAEKALQNGDYAKAWSLLKTAEFWELWKDYLEKAYKNMARLPQGVQVKERKDIFTIPALHVLKVATTPSADLSAPEWRNVPVSERFLTIDNGRNALNQTVVKGLYDKDNLYLGFICADKSIDELKSNAKSEKDIFRSKDDVLGIMIQPHSGSNQYYQLAFNSSGIHFDQEVVGSYRNYAYSPDWKTDSRKNKDHWTSMVKIPFSAFGENAGPSKNWRVNFYRVQRDNRLPISVWSLPSDDPHAGKLHDKERYGKIVFNP